MQKRTPEPDQQSGIQCLLLRGSSRSSCFGTPYKLGHHLLSVPPVLPEHLNHWIRMLQNKPLPRVFTLCLCTCCLKICLNLFFTCCHACLHNLLQYQVPQIHYPLCKEALAFICFDHICYCFHEVSLVLKLQDLVKQFCLYLGKYCLQAVEVEKETQGKSIPQVSWNSLITQLCKMCLLIVCINQSSSRIPSNTLLAAVSSH